MNPWDERFKAQHFVYGTEPKWSGWKARYILGYVRYSNVSFRSRFDQAGTEISTFIMRIYLFKRKRHFLFNSNGKCLISNCFCDFSCQLAPLRNLLKSSKYMVINHIL